MVDAGTQTENQTSSKCNCYQSETEGTKTGDTEKDEVADTDTGGKYPSTHPKLSQQFLMKAHL